LKQKVEPKIQAGLTLGFTPSPNIHRPEAGEVSPSHLICFIASLRCVLRQASNGAGFLAGMIFFIPNSTHV
jgi:hypothetical protein